MAFADYFHKNIQAAFSILQGFDESEMRARLSEATVGIAFDRNAVSTAEGEAALDLSIRLAARFYPRLALVGLDDISRKKHKKYEDLANAVNPKIELQSNGKGVSFWAIIGATKIDAKVHGSFYIGSDNWIAKLSNVSPVTSGKSSNPFAAGVAACLGASNIYRSIFAKELSTSQIDNTITLSVLDIKRKSRQTKNVSLGEIAIGNVHLVGAGAVGNGFIWALSQTKNAVGQLTVVDGEALELGNVQRYVMATPADVGKEKALLASDWLSSTGLSLTSKASTWEEYVAARKDWNIDCVAVAVDSADTRIRVQSSLPKTIFNSWTQAAEVGLSRHGFLGEEACLACLYLPKKKALNFDEIVLNALKLPNDGPNLMEVRARLDTGQPTERDYLERIANAASISLDRLLRFEGQPLRKFYVDAVCGGAVLEFMSGPDVTVADVPMAFQSALAGILLAADLVAEFLNIRPRLPTMTQIDLLHSFPVFPSTYRKKDPELRCICRDLDFIEQYRAKYEPSSRTSKQRPRAARPRRLRAVG